MIRQYKTSALLNIAGLTVAFASFYIIMAQVWWSLGYNKSIKDADRIYMIELPFSGSGVWTDAICRPLAEQYLPQIPEVESFACYWSSASKVWKQDLSGTDFYKFNSVGARVSLDFFELFSFVWLDGDVTGLTKPNTIAISESLARQHGVNVGDVLYFTDNKPKPEDACEVVAVYRDFAKNTFLIESDYYRNLGEENFTNHSEWSNRYFVKARPGEENKQRMISSYSSSVRDYFVDKEKMQSEEQLEMYAQVHFAPFDSLYFDSYAQQQGSRVTVYSLLALALVVIALAFINFVNFFFALVPIRIRTVNTCKIFGASSASLRAGFIFEAVGLVVISFALASALTYAFQFTDMANMFTMSLSFKDNMAIVAITLAVGVVMSLVASLYPAWYITSFSPAMVVKGGFSGSKSGTRLRSILLGVQFFCSIGLIIFTAFMFLQRNYLLNFDLGYNIQNILTFNVRTNDSYSYEMVRERLMGHPDVVDVTGTQMIIFSDVGMEWGRKFNEKQFFARAYEIKTNFFDFMGINIVEGRAPRESDVFKEPITKDNYKQVGGVLVINEQFARNYDYKPLRDLNGGGFFLNDKFIGICKDFYFKPLRTDSENVILYLTPMEQQRFRDSWGVQFYVRYLPNTDIQQLVAHIRSVMKEIDPSYVDGDLQIETFEQIVARAYKNETRMTKIFATLALISIIIALMGVFGIVLFETQRTRHEIAIRKAVGATTNEILQLFNMHYVKIVIICFVLVLPFTIYGLNVWLESYAYRTPLYWWVFAMAFVVVVGITILTVTVRSWRAASENPVNALKKE